MTIADLSWWAWLAITVVAALLLYRLGRRLQLSAAKHPTLLGHSKMLRFFAKWVPNYDITEDQFYRCDGAPEHVVAQRRAGFSRLATELATSSPKSGQLSDSLESDVSDLRFTKRYRVPYQFANYVSQHLAINTFVAKSAGTQLQDVDGNWSDDLSGAYGVNLFGYDFYKQCMQKAGWLAGELGPVLGPYHPVIERNVQRLKAISGMDEVSFHMSGTEAVMQAVRLARYHTGKDRLVQFCGAYHGWWDGVQPGLGNTRKTRDVYTLSEGSKQSLGVLASRDDIACVLINPLQALHMNRNAPSDSTLLLSRTNLRFDKQAYRNWLHDLRQVCTAKGIVMIIDEVFVGFRLAKGGAQEFFDVRADMVTYGKTLGGGFPVGVVCGRADLMRRYKIDQPTNVCFARGTFNSHPHVLGAMDAFLTELENPTSDLAKHYADLEPLWNERAKALNQRLEAANLPVRVANMLSIWAITFPIPGRYHWLFQYYLKANGITLGWVGTGKLIFSHNFSDTDFTRVADKIVGAAEQMNGDGWFWQDAHAKPFALKVSLAKEFANALLARRAAG